MHNCTCSCRAPPPPPPPPHPCSPVLGPEEEQQHQRSKGINCKSAHTFYH